MLMIVTVMQARNFQQTSAIDYSGNDDSGNDDQNGNCEDEDWSMQEAAKLPGVTL